MRSTSRLAVRMPDGDFFWNAWRTYTAFSNRTVYTARYAFPSCDSTTSSTPGPSPFQGFAVGAVPPNCAMPRAFPMSSLTAAGKLRKSRLEDPTQCNGFSSAARTRRTPRLSQFWDNRAILPRGEQEGEHRGGTPPLREVFPLPGARLHTNRGRCRCAEVSDCFRQLQLALRVARRMR